MLNDLSFIQPNKIFPPVCETERLQNYKDNLLLFNDSTYLVSKREFKDSNQRIIRILNDYSDIIGYPIDLNYHKLTSVSIADLVCGEQPTIKCEKDKNFEKLVTSVDFYNKIRQWVIDISRQGDAVSRVYSQENKDGSGAPAVAVVQPSSLFKVVDVDDKDHLLNIVLATPVELEDSTKEKPKWELRVQIHYEGYYIKKIFKLEPIKKDPNFKLPSGRTNLDLQRFIIKQQIGKDEEVKTGISDFAVRSMHQLVTSDSCYGHDDYASLDPILAEIWARLGQIAIILDKHTRPDVYAALSAFEQNSRGEWQLKVGGGNTYALNQGDPIPGYLTWDGQLVACFNELNLLFEQLYKVSEMGPIYEAAGKSTNIAWETMKATFVKPLAKARRITNDITNELKKILSSVAQLNGQKIEPEDITIDWYDGLPNDEKQEIEKATMKINADLSTPEQENVDRFNLTQEMAKEIAEKVDERNSKKQASMFGGFSSPTPNDDEGE